MSNGNISSPCDRCGSSGFESGEIAEIPCPKCSGSGNILLGHLDQGLVDDIESTKGKVDWLKKNVKEILKHLDISEK